MKAYVYYEAGVPWKLEDVPDPQPGYGEVLIKIDAAGVCGTDVGYRFGHTKLRVIPLIPGHEIAGTVVQTGADAEGVQIGDRVCVHYILSCARCRHCNTGNDNRCRNRISIGTHVSGGFAEYIVVPARNAFKLPDTISFEEGAIIGCAVTTAYHAVHFGQLVDGDTVVVFGLGGVGLQVIKWARFAGAARVIAVDIMEAKLAVAQNFGADVVINALRNKPSQKVREITDGYGADMAFECAGHPDSMREALLCIQGKSGYESGRLVGVAAFLDKIVIDQPLMFREGAFLRSGDHTREDLRTVIDLVGSGRVDVLEAITHRISFGDLERPLNLLKRREGNVIRAVLVPDA